MGDRYHPLPSSYVNDNLPKQNDPSVSPHQSPGHGLGHEDPFLRHQGDGTEWFDLSDIGIHQILDPRLIDDPSPTNDTTQTAGVGTHQNDRPESPPLLAEKVSTSSVVTPTKRIEKRTSKDEKPKKVSSTRLRRAIIDFVLFQVPSVAVTVFLLVLYIRRFTWYPNPTQLSGLLFAARVHESLIVASLFQILYYHIRRSLLLDGGGLSFGLRLPSSWALHST